MVVSHQLQGRESVKEQDVKKQAQVAMHVKGVIP